MSWHGALPIRVRPLAETPLQSNTLTHEQEYGFEKMKELAAKGAVAATRYPPRFPDTDTVRRSASDIDILTSTTRDLSHPPPLVYALLVGPARRENILLPYPITHGVTMPMQFVQTCALRILSTHLISWCPAMGGMALDIKATIAHTPELAAIRTTAVYAAQIATEQASFVISQIQLDPTGEVVIREALSWKSAVTHAIDLDRATPVSVLSTLDVLVPHELKEQTFWQICICIAKHLYDQMPGKIVAAVPLHELVQSIDNLPFMEATQMVAQIGAQSDTPRPDLDPCPTGFLNMTYTTVRHSAALQKIRELHIAINSIHSMATEVFEFDLPQALDPIEIDYDLCSKLKNQAFLLELSVDHWLRFWSYSYGHDLDLAGNLWPPSIGTAYGQIIVPQPSTLLISSYFPRLYRHQRQSGAPSDGPLTEFTCFPRLPKELQAMVWRSIVITTDCQEFYEKMDFESDGPKPGLKFTSSWGAWNCCWEARVCIRAEYLAMARSGRLSRCRYPYSDEGFNDTIRHSDIWCKIGAYNEDVLAYKETHSLHTSAVLREATRIRNYINRTRLHHPLLYEVMMQLYSTLIPNGRINRTLDDAIGTVNAHAM